MTIKIDRMELADLSNPTPKALAAAVLKQLVDTPLRTPIEEIALGCGITEIQRLTTKGFEGALLTRDDTKMVGIILVNKFNIPTRRRFTIAHELGHLLNPWHMPPEGGFQCSAEDMLRGERNLKDRQRMEVEANHFAAEILMPEASYKRQLRLAGGDVTIQAVCQLSDDFDVSKLAAARRLCDLNKDCALVLSCNGAIDHTWRGQNFPYISLRNGQPVPRKSVTRSFGGGVGAHSDIRQVDPELWTTTECPRGLKFLEQVLVQAKEYRLTMLVLDESEVEDEEDEYVRERSEREPSFYRK